MEQIQFGRWQLACDPEATRAIYSGLALDTTPPGCEGGCNFLPAREQGLVFPPVVMQLFEQLGIDYLRDAEHYHVARLDSGLHEFGGWFHFVGSILSGGDTWAQVAPNAWQLGSEQITANFAVGFTERISLLEPPFKGHPVVQLEFDAHGVPWLLGEPEPT